MVFVRGGRSLLVRGLVLHLLERGRMLIFVSGGRDMLVRGLVLHLLERGRRRRAEDERTIC